LSGDGGLPADGPKAKRVEESLGERMAGQRLVKPGDSRRRSCQEAERTGLDDRPPSVVGSRIMGMPIESRGAIVIVW